MSPFPLKLRIGRPWWIVGWIALLAGVNLMLSLAAQQVWRGFRDATARLVLEGSTDQRDCGGKIGVDPSTYERSMTRPVVIITSTDIKPEQEIKVGASIHAQARLSQPVQAGQLVLATDKGQSFSMFDDGTHGDAKADDRTWELDLPCTQRLGSKHVVLWVQTMIPGLPSEASEPVELQILPEAAVPDPSAVAHMSPRESTGGAK